MLTKEEFVRWYIQEFGDSPDTESGWNIRNEIYDYFAPLLRGEFPREALTAVIKDLIHRILENAEDIKSARVMETLLSVDVIQNNAEKTIITLKRLWDGGEAGSIDDPVFGLWGCCSMCGDSKQVPIQAYEQDYIQEEEEGKHWKPCPVCKLCPTCGGSKTDHPHDRVYFGKCHCEDVAPDRKEQMYQRRRDGGACNSPDQRKGQRRKSGSRRDFANRRRNNSGKTNHLGGRRTGGERRGYSSPDALN